MIPRGSFDFHFSNNERCWALFHMFVGHLYVFFGEISIWYSIHFLIGLFFFLVLSCMSYLPILQVSSLSVVSFAIIFSHFEGCLLTLFCCAKTLSLIRSHLFTFVFISITLVSGSERILLWCRSKSILFMLSSQRFIVSDLTFESLLLHT